MKMYTFFCVGLALLCFGNLCWADVLSFDDVTTAQQDWIPDEYGGFDVWSVFCVGKASLWAGSGYYNGLVSGDYVAYNGDGSAAEIQGQSFNIAGAYFTAAWNDGLNIDIEGYRDGALVYTRTAVVDTSGPTWVQLDITAVNRVRFTSYGGTHNPEFTLYGTQFAMDDMSYSFNVSGPDLCDPEQSSRSFAPTTVRVGQPFEVHTVIHNIGVVDSGAVALFVYASTDPDIAVSDHLLGWGYTSSGVPAGGSTEFNWTRSFPADVPAGTYYVGWIIDPGDFVAETNEDNNTAYVGEYQLTVGDGTTPPDEPGDEIIPSASCDFSPGDRVVLLVVPLDKDGRHAVGLYPGAMGTVVCRDHSDPALPLFVSWDNWTNGKNSSFFCDPPVISYTPNSGWWMACTQIGRPGQPIGSCPRALMAKWQGKVVPLIQDSVSANTYAGTTTLSLEPNSRVGISATASATSPAGGTWTAWVTPSTVGPGPATVELSVRGTNVNAGVLACGETTNVATVTLSLGPPEPVDEVIHSDDGDLTPPVTVTSLPEDPGSGGSTALTAIRDSYDWRAALTLPLENPGQGTCGSCWAFTFAKAFQAKIELNNGGVLDLSEQDLVVRADAGGCCGGTFDAARALLESEGPILGDMWPYREGRTRCPVQTSSPGKPTCYHLPYRPSPKSFGAYRSNDDAKHEAIKLSLALDGPGYLSFITGDASSYAFRDFWHSGLSPGSVFRYNSSEQQWLPQSPSRKSHAVTLIGWDDSKHAWLCLNSWGPGGPNRDGTFWLGYDACVKGIHNFRVDLLRPASSEMVVQFAPSSTYGSYWLTISGSSKFVHLSIGHTGPRGNVEYAYYPPQDINVSVSFSGTGTAIINATPTAPRHSDFDTHWSISKRIDDARLAGRKIQIKATFDTAAGTSTYNSPQFNSTAVFESGGFQ